MGNNGKKGVTKPKPVNVYTSNGAVWHFRSVSAAADFTKLSTTTVATAIEKGTAVKGFTFDFAWNDDDEENEDNNQ